MIAATEGPLVTVVMIFLNAERFIVEAIESVRAQTYTAWELILVDDGSSDGSTAIAKDYAVRFADKIRYTEHEGHQNRGMSASRNRGVAEGRGAYVSFLDSDDVWLPERLTHFVDLMAAFPDAGMAYGPTLFWYSWAEALGLPPVVPNTSDFTGRLGLPPRTLVPAPNALAVFLESHGGMLPGICSLLVRRTAFDAVGGFEPAFRSLYEDQVFLSKMTATHAVVVTDAVLDRYRQHSDSCCYRAIEAGEYDPNEVHPARGHYLQWLKDWLASQGIADPRLAAALRRQFWPYRNPRAARAVRMVTRLPNRTRTALRRHLPPPVFRRLQRIKQKVDALRGRFRRTVRRLPL
jgi:glycosyltransferase involved in cell wall biosynthesis